MRIPLEIWKRELDHIWLPLWLFPRCVVRQFQKEQPFIGPSAKTRKLRRPIAGLDDTRILHLFDVLIVLHPLGSTADSWSLCTAVSGLPKTHKNPKAPELFEHMDLRTG